MGQSGAEEILDAQPFESTADNHQYDSQNPASPFVSVTTRREVAEQFSDVIATIETDRAIPNSKNILGEQEYLVPLVINPNEIISVEGIE